MVAILMETLDEWVVLMNIKYGWCTVVMNSAGLPNLGAVLVAAVMSSS